MLLYAHLELNIRWNRSYSELHYTHDFWYESSQVLEHQDVSYHTRIPLIQGCT